MKGHGTTIHLPYPIKQPELISIAADYLQLDDGWRLDSPSISQHTNPAYRAVTVLFQRKHTPANIDTDIAKLNEEIKERRQSIAYLEAMKGHVGQ